KLMIIAHNPDPFHAWCRHHLADATIEIRRHIQPDAHMNLRAFRAQDVEHAMRKVRIASQFARRDANDARRMIGSHFVMHSVSLVHNNAFLTSSVGFALTDSTW